MACLRHWTNATAVAKRRGLSPASLSSVASHAAAAAGAVSSRHATNGNTSAAGMLWPYTAKLVEGILAGSRTSLSRAITLVESHRLDHRRQAELLLDRVLSARQASQAPPLLQGSNCSATTGVGSCGRVGGASRGSATATTAVQAGDAPHSFPKLGMRVGIAGPPGAGKSTFIEVLGKDLTAAGNKVAVISIDPSSIRTGGSILGDKTRMHELSRDASAFVRGCPARGVLGGLSRYTHEVVLLCQVAGYDPVIVETVGLGQSEVEVEHTVDMLLLMLPPAGGDALQGSKKGIVEVADAIVVNKADGKLETAARATASDYAAALGFARRKISCWAPPVLRCSAIRKEGIGRVWEQVLKFRSAMEQRGLLDARRRQQAMHWVQRHLQQQLMERASRDPAVRTLSRSLESDLAAGTLSPRAAAERLADCLINDTSSGRR